MGQGLKPKQKWQSFPDILHVLDIVLNPALAFPNMRLQSVVKNVWTIETTDAMCCTGRRDSYGLVVKKGANKQRYSCLQNRFFK